MLFSTCDFIFSVLFVYFKSLKTLSFMSFNFKGLDVFISVTLKT